MEHSIALVTGATSGVGYAAARTLAGEGWREIIVTGRSLGRAQETAAQLAAETKTQVFTPLELDLDKPSSVQSALAELVKRGRPVDFLLLNAGIVGGKARVLTAAGVEASQAPLIGHHQLTVGLLRANLLSPNARIVIAGSEAARGDVPMFSYTDLAAFAATHHQGDRSAAVEALVRSGPNVKTDRFYRNFRDYVSVDELQVSLHFPKENVVLSHDSTSHEKFMHGIKVLMAKNYIDNLSEEVRKGMLEKCEQGGWPAQAPLGYVNIIREDKKRVVVVDAERVALIRKLYETYARGAHSVKQVAKLARGWGLTFRKSGAPVSTATVHNILRNRFYCGDFVWDGRTYRGAHEALVTRDLWHRVQDVLDGRNAIHPKRRKHQFLFAGLIRCGHCGCAMVTERHKGRYHYLRCTGNRGKCPTGYTRQEVIESHVATLLDRMTFPEPALKYLTTALRESNVDEKKFHDEAIARLEAEYDVIQKRLDAMYLDKLDGRITAAYFDRMAADWRDELDRIAEAIHEHRQANRGQIADGARILEVASEAGAVFRGQEDDSEKRELLRFFLAESSWTENGLAASLRQPFDVLAGEAEKLRRIEGSNGGDKVDGPAGGRLNSSGDRDSNSRVVAQGSDRAKIEIWSGRRDLNPRPLGPQPSALPGYATPRSRASLRGRPYSGRS